MSNKIVFNGKEYNSADEMPADVRAAYQQAMGIFADGDKNGIPDILEGKGSINIQPAVFSSSTIIYDGKTYASVNDLPPEARQKYEEAMAKLDANHDGIPDVLNGNVSKVQFKTNFKVGSGTGNVNANQPANDSRMLFVGLAIILLLALIAALLFVLILR
jgi:hypothetical protein